jgi:hypothetical protein
MTTAFSSSFIVLTSSFSSSLTLLRCGHDSGANFSEYQVKVNLPSRREAVLRVLQRAASLR